MRINIESLKLEKDNPTSGNEKIYKISQDCN